MSQPIKSSGDYTNLVHQIKALDVSGLENVSKRLSSSERDLMMKAMNLRSEESSNPAKQTEINNLVAKLKKTSTKELTGFEKIYNTINYLVTGLFPNKEYIKTVDFQRHITRHNISEVQKLDESHQLLNEVKELANILPIVDENLSIILSQAIEKHDEGNKDRPTFISTNKKTLIYLDYNIANLESGLKNNKFNDKQTEKASEIIVESYKQKRTILEKLVEETKKNPSIMSHDDIQALNLEKNLTELRITDIEIAKAQQIIADAKQPNKNSITSLTNLYENKLTILVNIKTQTDTDWPHSGKLQEEIDKTTTKIQYLKSA